MLSSSLLLAVKEQLSLISLGLKIPEQVKATVDNPAYYGFEKGFAMAEKISYKDQNVIQNSPVLAAIGGLMHPRIHIR